MSEFLRFLDGLVCEGETLLVVKQKPVVNDGELQFHADGAVKCTWPAFRPERWSDDGSAWYINTGIFIESRMGRRLSASAANCDFCAFLVLDDVGTKSRVPPLEPTWKIETSPGNYQWGYAFDIDHQPKAGDFAAAVRAIAAAGYTDPGAINAVRNVRLPGSVNIKPGRNGFKSVLEEFHPARVFTLPQICESLGVVPGEADTGAYQPLRVADNGRDDVVTWLNEHGVIIAPLNGSGWMGVVCPNHAQHTDGNPEARYHPVSRSFSCMHAHCSHLDSATFLDWVAANGGPAHAPGMREDLMVAVMRHTLIKLGVAVDAGDHGSLPEDAGGVFTDSAATRVEEAEEAEDRRAQLVADTESIVSEWFTRYAYDTSNDGFIDLEDRRFYSRRAFNALHRAVDCRTIHPRARGSLGRIDAGTLFDEQRVARGAIAVVGQIYAAGEPAILYRDGGNFANRWRDGRAPRHVAVGAGVAVPDIGGISVWLKHAETLLPDEAERNHVFDFMAFKLQHPEIKINYGILHGGVPGCGKDTLWAPFFWAVGDHNVSTVTVSELTSAFSYHLESEVIIINEMRQTEAKDRRGLENRLKPLLAAPPLRLPVNRKGEHPFDVLNRAAVVAFSNDRDAIVISGNDRRIGVIWSDALKMSRFAAAQLWNNYKSGLREQVAQWLYARDVSAFDPASMPVSAETSTAKQIMIEAGYSVQEEFFMHTIAEDIASGTGEFGRGVIAGPWFRLCDRLGSLAPDGYKLHPAALKHALQESGWIDLGRLHSAKNPSKVHTMCTQAMVHKHSRSELRDLVAVPVETTLKIVK